MCKHRKHIKGIRRIIRLTRQAGTLHWADYCERQIGVEKRKMLDKKKLARKAKQESKNA